MEHNPLSPSYQRCLTGFSFISWVFSTSPPRILVVMKNVWSPSHLFLASSFCLTVSDYIGNVHCPPDKSKHLTQTDFCRQKNFLLPGKKDPCCQAKNGSIMIYTGSFLRNIFLYFSLNLLPQWLSEICSLASGCTAGWAGQGFRRPLLPPLRCHSSSAIKSSLKKCSDSSWGTGSKSQLLTFYSDLTIKFISAVPKPYLRVMPVTK